MADKFDKKTKKTTKVATVKKATNPKKTSSCPEASAESRGRKIEKSNASIEHKVRLEKAHKLELAGIPAWAPYREIKNNCAQVAEEFQEESTARYEVAGRLMSIREHGKTAFANIVDPTAKLQIYLKQDLIGPEKFEFFQDFIDIGDYIWVAGTVFLTRTGEITLLVDELQLLSKCLHPLPEKFHGLADTEIRYRQRYLDLIVNEKTRKRFLQRSEIVRAIRNYLENQNFLEVETPMLHPIPGGATAKPFVTHHNALDIDLYLRIAPELYLKRLVVGGFERVYELNRCFRNEGLSTKHNPEFTTVEFYMAHADSRKAMDFVEEMVRSVVARIHPNKVVKYGDNKIDFEKPFARLSLREAIIKHTDITDAELKPGDINTLLKKLGIDTKESLKKSHHEKLFLIFEETTEDKLIQPTFIVGYPIEVSPLARRSDTDKELVDRWELFIAGYEIANAYTELNDPIDQGERFKRQAEQHERGDEEAHLYDVDYVRALEYGMPPTAGVGIGIDRLTMVLTDASSIRDVVLFPTLRPKND